MQSLKVMPLVMSDKFAIVIRHGNNPIPLVVH